MVETSIAAEAAAEAAVEAVKATAESPKNDLSPVAVANSAVELEANVAKAMQPVIEHITNNEVWYQSRVMLGSIAAIGGGLSGFYFAWQSGVRDWEILSPFVGSVIGGAFSIYGRFIARKPLGA